MMSDSTRLELLRNHRVTIGESPRENRYYHRGAWRTEDEIQELLGLPSEVLEAQAERESYQREENRQD